MNLQYFRAGSGAVIYRYSDYKILVFKRLGQEVWQFPQGGLNPGENSENGMWRELAEETTLTKNNFTKQIPYPTWTFYKYPDDFIHPARANCIGQAHRWWFLKLKPTTEINLAKATDKEFDDYQWLNFGALLILEKKSFKQSVYQELYKFFSTKIQSH